MKATQKALLIMPFFMHESAADQLRSLFMEAFLRRLTAEHHYVAEIIKSDESRQGMLGKSYHSKITNVELVVADLYSNNKNVSIEATISCLYGINTYLMAPRALKGEPFRVAAYFGPYVGHTYDDEDVDNAKADMEAFVKLGGTRDEYEGIVRPGSRAFLKFDEWYADSVHNELSENGFVKTIRGDFERIEKGIFDFGKPLLDEMERSPFSQLFRTDHLMDFEARAEEIWVFANDITIGIEMDTQKIMLQNLINGKKYKYILPEDQSVQDNVTILRRRLREKLKEKEEEKRIEAFQVCFVPRELVGQEVTMLNPTGGDYRAYLLDIYDDGRYLLRMNDNEANRVRNKHNRLWAFDWTLSKKEVDR